MGTHTVFGVVAGFFCYKTLTYTELLRKLEKNLASNFDSKSYLNFIWHDTTLFTKLSLLTSLGLDCFSPNHEW